MKSKLKRIVKRGIIILFILFGAFIAFILNETKDEVNADFENVSGILNKLRKKHKNAGFAVSVFNKDTVLFQKGFGFSDIKSKNPYIVTTRQYIASVSKTQSLGIGLSRY